MYPDMSQGRVFEEHTSLSVGKYCGEVNVFDWSHELATRQVKNVPACLCVAVTFLPGCGTKKFHTYHTYKRTHIAARARTQHV